MLLPEPGADGKDGATGGVAAVERALAIVAALEAEAAPISLAQLARRTGFYKSTALRLIASLERFGYVVRLEGARYQLGPAAFRLGHAYGRSHKLVDVVLPVLHGLVAQGTESPSFHVRHDQSTRLCLARIDSGHSTLDRVRTGDVLPLDRGAAGRILLAFDGEPGAPFDALRAAMVAVSYGERDPSCAGLAAPVFGADQRVAGALSVSGPRERFTDGAVTRMTGLVLEAAAALSAALGGDAAMFRRKAAS